jgi:hypothetical protein
MNSTHAKVADMDEKTAFFRDMQNIILRGH